MTLFWDLSLGNLGIAFCIDPHRPHHLLFQRKHGLFKKAYELGVLCSVEVAIIIVGMCISACAKTMPRPCSIFIISHIFFSIADHRADCLLQNIVQDVNKSSMNILQMISGKSSIAACR
jgi:SRF-type transcription factor (DNA-binding and dimerisation domain)